jgi:hypothetical protein
MRAYLQCFLAIAGLLSTPAFAQSPPPKTTDVLVMLTVKPEAPHELVLKTMPDEVRATVRLYLDGKIRQWYGRSDGHGVAFLLACKDIDEARSIMDGLPLSKHNLVDLEFTALTPLTPLRYLLNEPAARP